LHRHSRSPLSRLNKLLVNFIARHHARAAMLDAAGLIIAATTRPAHMKPTAITEM
jgi:hypothetical protein